MTATPQPLSAERLLEICASRAIDETCIAEWSADPQYPAILEAAAEALHREALGDVRKATRCGEELRLLADRLGMDRCRAAARLALGIAQTYANHFDDALATLAEAASIAQHATPPLVILDARAGLARVHVLARLGRLDDAVEVGERSLLILDREGPPALAARAHANLGVLERMRQRPDRAIDRFHAALAAWGPEVIPRAQLTSNLAEALLDLGRFEEAEQAFRKALTALEEAQAGHAAAIVEGNLADLLNRQGRVGEALMHFERVRQHHRSLEAHGDAARLQAEEADAFASIGLLGEAVAEYRAALVDLDRFGLHLEAIRARLGLARALGRWKRRDEASRVLDAIETSTDLPPLTGASVHAARGEIALASGEPQRARDELRTALALVASRPVDRAVIEARLAQAELALGALDAAESAADDAATVARSHFLRPLEVEILHTKARIAQARGDTPGSLALLRASVDRVEQLRGTLQASRLRSAFLAEHGAAAGDLVRSLVRAGDARSLREALVVMERVRSRGLLDAITGAVPVDAIAVDEGSETSALLREAAAIRHEANALFSQLDREPGIGAKESWRRSVEEVELRRQLIESRMEASRSDYAAIARTPDEATVAAIIDQEIAHVVTFVAGDRVILIASRAGAIMGADLGLVHEIGDLIERFRFQVHRSLMASSDRAARIEPQVDAAMRGLAERLFGPCATLLRDADRVQCVPAGPLQAIPLAALPVGDVPLGERALVGTVPSLGVLRALARAASQRASGGRVVVGVADADAPAIAAEARLIAAMPGTTASCLGADASAERVRELAQHARVMHIATHGRFVPESPLRSGIRLADGWLTVTDLFRWRFPGSTIVVSGCDTGRAAIEIGDEITGLQRGFFAAGASGLVLSNWLTHDERAVAFMRDLHERLGTFQHGNDSRGASAGRALQQAMRASRLNGHRLVDWAAFSYIGSC